MCQTIMGKISRQIAYDRLAWVERMLSEIRALPLDSREVFSLTAGKYPTLLTEEL